MRDVTGLTLDQLSLLSLAATARRNVDLGATAAAFWNAFNRDQSQFKTWFEALTRGS